MAVHTDLLTAVSQQLDSPDTPFVLEAHKRLVADDISPEEAKEMIAHCLADELDEMAKDKRNFDLGRYKLLLSLLPALPEA